MKKQSPHRIQRCSVRLHSLIDKSCPTLCDPMDTGEPARLLCLLDSPGKNTGVGCHFLLLQGVFWTQGSNLCLLHWQVILYHSVTWEAYHELGGGKLAKNYRLMWGWFAKCISSWRVRNNWSAQCIQVK